MLTCWKCGLAAEVEEARFCEECGESLSPERQASACANARRGLKPRGSEANVDAGQEYVRAVEASLADGVLDAGDRAALDDTREQLNLSAGEAAALESQAKEAISGGGVSPAPAQEPSPPLVLEINDNHYYVEKDACTLEFRLLNQTDVKIEEVRFSIEAKYLGQIDERCYTIRPNNRDDPPDNIQIVPEKAGEHVINIALRFQVGGEPHVWIGQPLLAVFGKNFNPSTVVYSPTLTADKMLGVQVGGEFQGGLIPTPNVQPQRNYPERWCPVRLVRREADGPKPVCIVAELAKLGDPLKTASLVSREEDGRMGTLLLGLQEVRMGRHRGKNDIVLRRLPRTKKNEELTVLISARHSHLVIALRPDGLYINTGENINATRLDGRLVDHQMKVALDRPSEIDVAGALRLRLTPYLDADDEEEVDARRYKTLGSPDALWRMAEDVGLRSLLIERVDNLAGEERYLVIYRWASCGRAAGNELRWAHGGLQARHLRILRLGGRLWMESTVDASRLAVNGIQVGCGGAFPLTAGLTLRCPEWEARVEDFKQLWL